MDVPALIVALSRPEAYPHPVGTVKVHQTHISVVFLAGPFAYKIKKPVNLGFLDFSTLEKRKHFCEEEVPQSPPGAKRLFGRRADHFFLPSPRTNNVSDADWKTYQKLEATWSHSRHL